MARHGSLADQLTALREFVSRPEETSAPDQTSWSVVAANDNNPEDFSDVHVERRISLRPSTEEMMRQSKSRFERGPEVYSEVLRRNVPGPIIRIGNLRFSDGGQTERCMMAGIDGEPVAGSIRMPIGSMLGTKEQQERPLGGTGASPGESNAWFCDAFDVCHHEYVPGGKRRSGRSFSRDEAAAMLAEAIANTPVMPEVYQCEDGIAAGTARYADNFIGMKKAPKGSGGSIAWQDLSDKIAEREKWEEIERSLSDEDLTVLNAAANAKSYAEIGLAVRQSPEYARRKGGRRALIAANDNLMAAISAATAA
ncbi:hypothetical protein [Metarhizobium album]|nr:hypothetical protein [Rhizobium album]